MDSLDVRQMEDWKEKLELLTPGERDMYKKTLLRLENITDEEKLKVEKLIDNMDCTPDVEEADIGKSYSSSVMMILRCSSCDEMIDGEICAFCHKDIGGTVMSPEKFICTDGGWHFSNEECKKGGVVPVDVDMD